jgi:predicted N-formylglutamate amidohydrolase
MRAFRPIELILSCEHGGNRVPPRYRRLFSKALLATHRGYDPGALTVARDFAAATGARLFYSTISRLLVELNRALEHHQVFSARALRLPPAAREELLQRYYFPYWKAVEARVAQALRRGRRVLHLSCHSFTPRLAGVQRMADIGLLFDPRRALEARFCHLWRDALLDRAPRLRVRENYPYLGTTDSLTNSLRKKFAAQRYLGVSLEINQKFPRGDERRWRALCAVLVASFEQALKRWSGFSSAPPPPGTVK